MTNYQHDPDKPIRTRSQAITSGLAAARSTLRREHGAPSPEQLRSRCDGELTRLQDTTPAPHPTAWAYWLSIHNTLTSAGFATTHPALQHLNRGRQGTWRFACTP